MKLNVWLVECWFGDLGGYRPCVWLRLPNHWIVLWLGWQRPDLMVLSR